MAFIIRNSEENSVSEEQIKEVYNRTLLMASKKPIDAVINAETKNLYITLIYEDGYGYFNYILKEDGDYKLDYEKENLNGICVIDTNRKTSDPTEKESVSTESIKNDFADKKPRWDLLPIDELGGVVDVYTAGAKKYGENRWQTLPNGVNRYLGAFFRHLTAYKRGEQFDPEDGCLHLDKCIWNMIAVRHCFLADQGINPNTSDYSALQQENGKD